MARTKQTARGGGIATPSRGRKRKQPSDDSSSDPLSSPERSAGGQPLAKFPRKSSPAKSSSRSTGRSPSKGQPKPKPPTGQSTSYNLPSFSTEDDDDDEVTLNIASGPTDGGQEESRGPRRR